MTIAGCRRVAGSPGGKSGPPNAENTPLKIDLTRSCYATLRRRGGGAVYFRP